MKPARKKIASVFVILVIAVSCLIIFFKVNSQKPVTAQVIRVACIGDSITEISNYPEQLQAMLGDGYLVGNFGVSGSAVSTNASKPYINQSAFQEAKDFQPQVVIIMLGTNDAKWENYRHVAAFPNDYTQIIHEYESLPEDQKIYLVTPPPIYDNQLGLYNSYLEQGVLPSIERVADDLDLPTIDVNEALSDHEDYFFDGVHPNSDGAEAIAGTISGAIIPDYDGFNYWDFYYW
jgi:lysophospholipase L1-like esterase